MFGLLEFLPLLALFYFVIMPIWLVIITRRQGQLRRDLRRMQGGERIYTDEKEERKEDEEDWDEAPVEPFVPDRTDEEDAKEPRDERSFEEIVGGNWFQWLGIGALILALAFFLKWSFDNGLIGETGRIVIGYIIAGSALFAGDRMRNKYGVWALTFTGGGAVASYITTWVALHVYEMFPPMMGMIVYVLTTVVVCLLAGYYKAIGLAAFGILGGFLTPILTGEGGSIVGLLSYVLIIDIGVLVLAHVCQWRVLNALSFICTVLWQFYALMEGDIAMDHAFAFLAAFGVIFLAVPATYNIVRRIPSDFGDMLVLIGNGLAHFTLMLWWLEEENPVVREMYDAPIALGFALLFLLFSMGVYMKNKKDTPLVLSSLSLTVLFASLAIPLQLGDEWTSLAWSLEAAFLLWISLQLKDKRIQLFAWPVMIFAYIWYLFSPNGEPVLYSEFGLFLFLAWVAFLVAVLFAALNNEREDTESFLPFVLVGFGVLVLTLFLHCAEDHRSSLTLVGRIIEAAGIIGGSYLALWEAKKKWSTLTPQEKQGFTALGIGVQVITLSFICYEFVRAIDDDKIFASSERPWQIKQVGVSIIWGLYGATTLVVGIKKLWKPLRMFSIILLLLTIAKLTLVDLFSLGSGARIAGFTVLGVLLVGSSFLYQKNKSVIQSLFTDDTPKT